MVIFAFMFLPCVLSSRRPLRVLVDDFKLEIRDRVGHTGLDHANDFPDDLRSKLLPFVQELAQRRHIPTLSLWMGAANLKRIIFVDDEISGIISARSLVKVTRDGDGVLTCTINVYKKMLESLFTMTEFLHQVDSQISGMMTGEQMRDLNLFIETKLLPGEVSKQDHRGVMRGILLDDSLLGKASKLINARNPLDSFPQPNVASWTFEYKTGLSTLRARSGMSAWNAKNGVSASGEENGAAHSKLQRPTSLPSRPRNADTDSLWNSWREQAIIARKRGGQRDSIERRTIKIITGDTMPTRMTSGFTFVYPTDPESLGLVKGLLADHFKHTWSPMMAHISFTAFNEFVLCDKLRYRGRPVAVGLTANMRTAFIDITMAREEGLDGDRATQNNGNAFDYNLRYVLGSLMEVTLRDVLEDVRPWQNIPIKQSSALRPRWGWNAVVHDIVSLFAGLQTATLSDLIRADPPNSPLRVNIWSLFRSMRVLNSQEHVRMIRAWRTNAVTSRFPALLSLSENSAVQTVDPINTGSEHLVFRCMPLS